MSSTENPQSESAPPSNPPLAPVRPNTRAFLAGIAVWAAVICAHFLACGYSAHWIGNPVHLPGWFKAFSRLFNYGSGAFVDFIVLALWLVYVLAAGFVIAFLAGAILPSPVRPKDAPLSTPEAMRAETAGEAIWRGGICCIPLLLMTGLTVAIFPAFSHNNAAAPTQLETIHGLSWDETIKFLAESLRAMSYIALLFGGLFIFTTLITSWKGESASGCWFFVSIFASIVLMTGVAVPLNPVLNDLEDRIGGTKTFLIYYAFIALFCAILGRCMTGPATESIEKKKEDKNRDRKGAADAGQATSTPKNEAKEPEKHFT